MALSNGLWVVSLDEVELEHGDEGRWLTTEEDGTRELLLSGE
jgi:hypothetical protein